MYIDKKYESDKNRAEKCEANPKKETKIEKSEKDQVEDNRPDVKDDSKKMIVGKEDDNTKELNKMEDLDCACKLWLAKVEEF
ncbi:5696_t:CDS:2 [Gigaspora margarita]|uniref:5696_t:CDS:1 n=1 Tax=Gigaspora margarita TaxID=4874 RepID=A0ABN7UGP0_GIGMA|nr:5696_t:CDS:2 [Gigaspora margarita]